MKEKTLVILAAGIGSRFGGTKQLAAITDGGETILDFSLYDAVNAGFTSVVFIVRDEILSEFRAAFDEKLRGKIKTQYVTQETNAIPNKFLPTSRTKPWGTAHAILMTQDFVRGNFCVINADDFYGRSAFEKMAAFLDDTDPEGLEFAMIGYRLKNTLSEYGGVSRGECLVNQLGYLDRIVERADIKRTDDEIVSYGDGAQRIGIDKNTIVSMNFWGFTDKVFPSLSESFEEFLESEASDENECFLPTVIGELVDSETATVKVLTNDERWIGITYKDDAARAAQQINELRAIGKYPVELWK